MDKSVIKDLETKAKHHEDLAMNYRAVVNDLMNGWDTGNAVPAKKPPKKNGAGSAKNTLPAIVTNKLNEGIPLTTRTLYDHYVDVTGKTKVKFTAFSGSVSAMQNVKKHVIPHNPIETQNYRGLDVWFDGDRLNQKYLDKIVK